METLRKNDDGSWYWQAKCGTSGSGTDRNDASNRLKMHKNTCANCKRS